MAHLVLALDVAGTPVHWVDIEKAICLHVAGRVAWELGDTTVTYRGGTNRLTGQVRGGGGNSDSPISGELWA